MPSHDFGERFNELDEFDQRDDRASQTTPDSGAQTPSQIESLTQIFHDQLKACLSECAAGRLGLFSDYEPLAGGTANNRAWPEAARLRELAFALQAVLAQADEYEPQFHQICEQFLDLCSIHGEHDPGEPRLARAFLSAIEGK